jgi:hypothetical protein
MPDPGFARIKKVVFDPIHHKTRDKIGGAYVAMFLGGIGRRQYFVGSPVAQGLREGARLVDEKMIGFGFAYQDGALYFIREVFHRHRTRSLQEVEGRIEMKGPQSLFHSPGETCITLDALWQQLIELFFMALLKES